MIGRSFGRYRIVSPLGEGGMSSVWLADDTLLARRVALKLLSPALAASEEARARFRHEIELAQLLDHPAIVPVLDADDSARQPWIAMAWITGGTLAARLERGPMPVAEACDTVAVVATALGYAHARGVLHRDVSPRNILLSDDGRVYLADFGMALVEGLSRLTRTGFAPGSLDYMSPEALLAQAQDPRSDLYSLCVVLYEALCGGRPHAGDTMEALLYARLNTVPRPARERRPEIPPGLDALLARGLAREPEQRFADADELLVALRSGGATPLRPGRADRRAASEARLEDAGVLYLGVPAFEVAAEDAPLAQLARDCTGALRSRLGVPRRVHVLVCADAVDATEGPLRWARRQGADLLLTGRVRRRGARVQVEYTLLDAGSESALGGDTLEGSPFDALELEDRLVASVRDRLPAAMPEERELPAAHAGLTGGSLEDRLAQALRYLRRHDHEPSVDAAMGLLERIVRAAPERIEAHVALARAYLARYALTKQHVWESRAASEVGAALAAAPDRHDVQLVYAELQALTGHTAEAVARFEQALAEAPGEYEGWLGLARAHMRTGGFRQAERACRRAIALAPRDWRGYSVLGSVYYHQGKYGHALAPWRKVLELSPDLARAECNLAVVLYHLDRFEESEAAARRSLELEPTAAAYANLGTVLYAQHRFEASVQAFERACDLRHADPRFWGYLAGAAERLPEQSARAASAYECAIGLMRDALERDPGHGENWAILSGWLASRGRADEARGAIARALELAPGHVRCMVEAAHTYTRLGQLEHALAYLGQAMRAGYGRRDIERSVELAPLREHPGYRAMLAGNAGAAAPRVGEAGE